MVPKFSHAFFLSTNLWLLAKHLLNFCQIHHFWQKFAFFRKSVIVKEAFIVLSFEFCSNFSCILPKFTIFAKIFYPRKNLFTNRPFFAIFFVIWIFGKPFITSYQMFTRIVIFVKIANSQHASFVISFDFCQTLWIAAKFAISVIIPFVKMPLFVISFVNFLKTFVKPWITSYQICHFLSSHLNIWPNPWWIFGILAIFAEICLYRLNFPFS